MNDGRKVMARAGRRPRRDRTAGLIQAPARQLRNPYPPFEILSADQVETVHQASLRVLAEIGVNFLLPEARDILKQAGADVEQGGTRVRFDPSLVEERIRTAPAQFTLHARNPERNVAIGGKAINFCMIGSAPHVSDLERGRITGNFADYCNLLRLGQSLNICHMIAGYPVEPIDLPPATRHLDAVAAMASLCDKPLYGYALGDVRIRDSLEITRIARQVTNTQLCAEPSMTTVVNANSPLQYDGPMLEGVIEMARHRQPIIMTPFTLAGAMAPITIAGALVQQNAEALAGIAFAQCVEPGAPVVYGSFTSNVDMKSGAPAFGTPEYAKATLASGQLARRYNLPFRASNATASNAPDAQSVYEAAMSVWPCVLAHCNIVKHGLGWLEGGLCASYEKVILDAELLQLIAAFLEPIETDQDSLGIEAMAEVGPGSHFFQAAHTMARYEHAFYTPLLSDWRNYETWQDDGALDATMRANRIWKQLLADYEPPPMDEGVAEEIAAFVAKRKEQGGVLDR
jgi:trimethylamine--corrinoid protein Co-methyltransferase